MHHPCFLHTHRRACFQPAPDVSVLVWPASSAGFRGASPLLATKSNKPIFFFCPRGPLLSSNLDLVRNLVAVSLGLAGAGRGGAAQAGGGGQGAGVFGPRCPEEAGGVREGSHGEKTPLATLTTTPVGAPPPSALDGKARFCPRSSNWPCERCLSFKEGSS